MLFEALGTARDLGRLRDIGGVLVRYGLGDFAHRVGIAAKLQRAGRKLNWDAPAQVASMQSPERLRRAIEDLGPTFVKLGQVLAGRADLFAPEWTRELSKLHEHASPIEWEEIEAQLTEVLGAPPQSIFEELDTTPLASASIAQVHRARLADGTQVVLKVRRPGIREVVESDLRLLAHLAEFMERELPESRRYHPQKLVRHFAQSLRNELDLSVEAHQSERIAQNMADQDGLVIPRIHWEWTSESLSVQDFLAGPSASAWAREPELDSTIDPVRITQLGAEALLKMVFVDGLYHADPHPGNFLLLAGNRIGLVDFGMIGRLSEARRHEFSRLLWAVVRRREELVVDTLLGWATEGEVDIEMLSHDCTAFIDRYDGRRIEELDTPALLADIADIVRANELSLPADMTMLLKLFITLEGTGRLLDPGFQMSRHVEPFVESAMRSRATPRAFLRRNLRELEVLFGDLPASLRQLLARLRHGNMKIGLDLERLDQFGAQLDHTGNRLTVGLVVSALIVGTAIALTVTGGPTLLGLPAFALLGFVSSLALGLGLIWSVLRSTRR